MTKEELLEKFTEDFNKTRGALAEVLDHNRRIDGTLVQTLLQDDFGKLEEHIEISKIITDGVKGFNELYKNTPAVLEAISKITDEGGDKDKPAISLADMMKDDEDKTESPEDED